MRLPDATMRAGCAGNGAPSSRINTVANPTNIKTTCKLSGLIQELEFYERSVMGKKEQRGNLEMSILHRNAAELLHRIAVSNEMPSMRDRAMASIYAQGLDKRHRSAPTVYRVVSPVNAGGTGKQVPAQAAH